MKHLSSSKIINVYISIYIEMITTTFPTGLFSVLSFGNFAFLGLSIGLGVL